MKKTYIVLVLLIIFSGFYLFSSKQKVNKPNDLVKDQSEKEEVQKVPEKLTSTVTFEELNLSVEVPKDLEVIKTPVFNGDNEEKLDAYTFYIQETKDSGEIGFQIYGLMQFDIPETTPELFSDIEEETDVYEYIKPIEVNGLKGYETKLSGERNNYVYMFLLDNRVLRIAVSPGIETSKTRADEIINSLDLTNR